MTSIGYLLPTRELVMGKDQPDFAPILTLAEHAEAAGFDSVWVGDSILARPRFEALTTLAAVAARTRRVRLGTAVMLPALRHPVILANEIANVDRISGGRLILGLGLASKTDSVAREFAACGVPHVQRVGRFEETITLLRRLWTEPSVSFEGRYFKLEDVHLTLRPIQQPGPPLWLAGNVAPAIERAVRLGDGWQPNVPTHETFAAAHEQYVRAAVAAGRDPKRLDVCLYTTINVNDDAAQAEREVRAFIEGYYDSSYDLQKKRQSVCAGTPSTCADWLNGFLAAGARSIVLRFGGPDQRAQIDHFVRAVLPRLRR